MIPASESARDAAVAASELLANGLAELLRFAREGALSEDFAFTDETVTQLAEALGKTIDLELPFRVVGDDPEGLELLMKLRTACTTFIEDYA